MQLARCTQNVLDLEITHGIFGRNRGLAWLGNVSRIMGFLCLSYSLFLSPWLKVHTYAYPL